MNTPITDAALDYADQFRPGVEVITAETARQLERDRARLLEAAESLKRALLDARRNGYSWGYGALQTANTALASLEIKEPQ